MMMYDAQRSWPYVAEKFSRQKTLLIAETLSSCITRSRCLWLFPCMRDNITIWSQSIDWHCSQQNEWQLCEAAYLCLLFFRARDANFSQTCVSWSLGKTSDLTLRIACQTSTFLWTPFRRPRHMALVKLLLWSASSGVSPALNSPLKKLVSQRLTPYDMDPGSLKVLIALSSKHLHSQIL